MYLYDHPKAHISAGNCPCQTQAQTQKRINALLDGSGGMPEEYRGYTFKTWDALPLSWTMRKKKARRIAEMFSNGPLPGTVETKRGLVLSGAVGRGKSGLAAAIIWNRAEKESVLWIDFRKFIRKVYDTIHNEAHTYEELVGAAASVPFLVWDDFADAETDRKVSDYLRNIVYDVISERYNERRATLITTNLDAEQVYEQFGDRIGDRVLKLCHWQVMDDPVNMRFATVEESES